MKWLVRVDRMVWKDNRLIDVEKKVCVVQNCERSEVPERLAVSLNGTLVGKDSIYISPEDTRTYTVRDILPFSFAIKPDVIWLS